MPQVTERISLLFHYPLPHSDADIISGSSLTASPSSLSIASSGRAREIFNRRMRSRRVHHFFSQPLHRADCGGREERPRPTERPTHHIRRCGKGNFRARASFPDRRSAARITDRRNGRPAASLVGLRIAGFYLSEQKMAFILGFLLSTNADSSTLVVIPELGPSGRCSV